MQLKVMRERARLTAGRLIKALRACPANLPVFIVDRDNDGEIEIKESVVMRDSNGHAMSINLIGSFSWVPEDVDDEEDEEGAPYGDMPFIPGTIKDAIHQAILDKAAEAEMENEGGVCHIEPDCIDYAKHPYLSEA